MGESSCADRMEAIRRASQLSDLAPVFGTDAIDELYFQAKETWKTAVRKKQERKATPDGFPGDCVTRGDTAFHVHGITHAGTSAERSFLRAHVSTILDRGAAVYCEQGIRGMYFADLPAVREMDDYRWLIARIEELDVESYLTNAVPDTRVDRFLSDLASFTDTFQEATFSLIESGRPIYGERFERALGDVAADFVTDPADLAIGKSYEAFALSRMASREPARLVALQQYYARSFLPQPLEREWLRRHDTELELVTHARNERMADYAVSHNESERDLHLIVGAAHQPGVVYYLERYRDGRDVTESFEFV